MQKPPKNLSAEQARQASRLSSALLKAVQSVMDMSDKEVLDNGITEKDRAQAVGALSWACRQIEHPSRNRFDLKLSVLLSSLDEPARAEAHKVLSGISSTLCQFVNQPWDAIQTAFSAADVRCPLALIKFHLAYQEKIRTSSGMSPNEPKSCCSICSDAP